MANDESIFEVSCEVEPVDDPEFPPDCEGALVDGFVASTSLREALDLVTGHLEEEGYRVVDIDRAARIDLDDYEPEDEDFPSADELGAALESGVVLMGPFDCYQSDDESDDD